MIRNDAAGNADELPDLRLHAVADHSHARDRARPRTIVIRHGSVWQSLAFLCLCLLLLAAVLMGHQALRGLDAPNQQTAAAMAGFERKVQQLESGLAFDGRRRYLLLGMRDRILKVNPRVSLADAYQGWTPKFAGQAAGVNYKNTFGVEDGVLRVSCGEYERFDGEFGHLFFKEPFGRYVLRIEYRFVGEQAPGGPSWAFRNSGVMFHSQSPESMGLAQSFPVSIEAQFLGGNGTRREADGQPLHAGDSRSL